jgi:hypothetical protein
LGDAELARGFLKRVETITEDDVWRHKAHIFVEAEYSALSGDLHALSRIADTMTELAELFTGWRPWLAYTRASIQRVRGNLVAAKGELESALAQAQAGEHAAWLAAAPAHAELLLLLDDAQGAEREARAILECVQSLGLRRSCAVEGQRVLALALSRQQQHAAARDALTHMLVLAHELDYGGLPRAKLHEAQARVALSSGNPRECVAILQEMWPLIERSNARALFAPYEDLREESAKQLGDVDLPAVAPAAATTTVESSTIYSEVQTLLAVLNRSQDRASQALSLLLQDTGLRAGHLLLLDANGLFAAVSLNDSPATSPLVEQAQQYIDTTLSESHTVTETADEAGGALVFVNGTSKLAPVLLANDVDDERVLVGLALLAVNDNQLRAPRRELVRAISQCLLAAGDSVAIAMNE